MDTIRDVVLGNTHTHILHSVLVIEMTLMQVLLALFSRFSQGHFFAFDAGLAHYATCYVYKVLLKTISTISSKSVKKEIQSDSEMNRTYVLISLKLFYTSVDTAGRIIYERCRGSV